MSHVGPTPPYLFTIPSLTNTALHVSIAEMVFEEGECGPDEDLRLHFEAISRMPDEDTKVIKACSTAWS